MEKYMGYRARETIKQNGEGRELPVFEIAGTKFLVDIARMEFRQADDPANRIMMQGVKEEMGFSHMLYDTQAKNHYLASPASAEIPGHVQLVIIPPLKDLDGIGLARRQGLPDHFYGGRPGNDRSIQLTGFQKETNKHQDAADESTTSRRRQGKRQKL